MSAGALIRLGTRRDPINRSEHDCGWPRPARTYPYGSVWRCVCGRRYTRTAVRIGVDAPRPVWARRRLPWPRKVKP